MSKNVETRSDGADSHERGTAAATIVLDRISHQFGARRVLKDISCSVSAGQTLIISGANGSGKSTLLRIVAGLLVPTGGAVERIVAGRALPISDARRFIGYVAPDLVLYKELTAAENLQFFGTLHGLRLEKGALTDLLARVGLRRRGRDLVGAYSSGMRQRLKYAFALLHDPPILLLDEPTANLDVNGVEMVERMLAERRERNGDRLTIIATNEPRELEWGALRIHLDAER
jgi:heme exporter protein A